MASLNSFLEMSSSYQFWILSGLRLVHFVGIILGVGAATLLDFIIIRFILFKRIRLEHVQIITFSSGIITLGLVLLWVSGIGFFIHYHFFNPAKMDNPKLLAKIIIVGVLTVNAFYVHHFVLPQFALQLGRRLLDGLSRFHSALLLLIGTISAISWYVPLLLGVVPQFNNNVPAESILADYSMLVFSINIVLQIALVIRLYYISNTD